MVESFKPQVAMLDIGMPGLNGYEVARRVRDRKSDVVVIAVTGWAQASDVKQAEAAGFHHYFVKPIDLERLQNILAQLC
jgi:CheY-like chemotaxis protein